MSLRAIRLPFVALAQEGQQVSSSRISIGKARQSREIVSLPFFQEELRRQKNIAPEKELYSLKKTDRAASVR